jgi:hypothetical protein
VVNRQVLHSQRRRPKSSCRPSTLSTFQRSSVNPVHAGTQQHQHAETKRRSTPVYFALAPANEGEREVAAAMLERARKQGLLVGGEVIAADKGFAGQEFEEIVACLHATLIRPDRKGEKPRFGSLGGMRQWIESVYETAKGQLSLEQHGGHTPDGVWARVCQRVLALAASVWHNWLLWEAGQIDAPGRHLTIYDH